MGKENAATVTEQDLLKSLDALDGKRKEVKADGPPRVATAAIRTSMRKSIPAEGSKNLQKAIEVSTILSEFAGMIGDHVDSSLETLEKSISEAAQRDAAVVRVLERMNKSIEALESKIEEYGKAPAAKATGSRQITKADVLEKSARTDGEGDTSLDPAKARTKILSGLQELAKSAAPGTPENNRYTQAAIQFEGTGKVDDLMMRKALAVFEKGSK